LIVQLTDHHRRGGCRRAVSPKSGWEEVSDRAPPESRATRKLVRFRRRGQEGCRKHGNVARPPQALRGNIVSYSLASVSPVAVTSTNPLQGFVMKRRRPESILPIKPSLRSPEIFALSPEGNARRRLRIAPIPQDPPVATMRGRPSVACGTPPVPTRRRKVFNPHSPRHGSVQRIPFRNPSGHRSFALPEDRCREALVSADYPGPEPPRHNCLAAAMFELHAPARTTSIRSADR
jgi:hypothetical protein